MSKKKTIETMSDADLLKQFRRMNDLKVYFKEIEKEVKSQI